ncbi:MAG TPA: deoxyribodipyrimidine photo-lyase [Planctomycetaceae bacterium]|nr:deoxyribodipyrimidine photo-lyase [Planctomycetaceae bacterium]
MDIQVADAADAPYGIHWFRRDLRVAGNPALQWNMQQHRGRVLGLFTFDKKFLARPDFSANRFAFFLDTLRALQQNLRSLGGDLLVLDVGPREGWSQLMAALESALQPKPAAVSFNRDYEPFARQRDAGLMEWIPSEFGVAVHHERDHLLIEPDELLREGKPGQFYQVFTPFAKRWFDLAATEEMQRRIATQAKGLRAFDQRQKGRADEARFAFTWPQLFGGDVPLPDQLEHYAASNRKKVTVPIPTAGPAAALKQLRTFLKHAAMAYHEQRDFPAINGTSHLSIFLKNGSLTSAQILGEMHGAGLDLSRKDGPTTFVKEIAWREFYYHVLYHRADVERNAFLPQYRELAWENREDWFDAWKRGETGYPVVDAGMRQLATTGWMHNRVRMIVASFLTKDLLIDWRWGEQYFMEQLLDGDLAPNNGGWQWAASTGCDPQPYFRIFNPKLQSQKFDPHGDYIRQYLPELAACTNRQIHDPHGTGAEVSYPQPIVNHAQQKDRALRLYRSVKMKEV